MRPGIVIVALWGLFALSWFAAAFWSSRPSRAVVWSKEAPSRVVLIVGGVLFAIPAHGYFGPMRLWYPSFIAAWTCAAIVLAGFSFSWWARVTMGKLWSGRITRKADHQLLDSGPFAIVRHPIYTGILTAVIGTMLVKGTVLGIVGATIIAAGLWMKARVEEQWLGDELGREVYGAYRRRVPMLVPFLPGARSG